MANRTNAERIAKLEERRDALEAALLSASDGRMSISVNGMSVSRSSPEMLERDLAQVERSLQRLYRGGRGFVVDMSGGGE